jgi:hypothetical protein
VCEFHYLQAPDNLCVARSAAKTPINSTAELEMGSKFRSLTVIPHPPLSKGGETCARFFYYLLDVAHGLEGREDQHEGQAQEDDVEEASVECHFDRLLLLFFDEVFGLARPFTFVPIVYLV